jgi:hypothetical protein
VQFELQEDSTLGSWTSLGGWFTSFVALGLHLGRYSDSGSTEISKILVTVPRKEFVSTAIALGVSIQRFNSKVSILKEIRESDLIGLPTGSKLRLVLNYGHLDVMFQKYFQDGKFIRCTIGGLHKSRDQLISPHIRQMFLLPSSFPEGDYTVSRQEYENSDKSNEREFWRTQGAPGVAIFGDLEKLKLQASMLVRNDLIAKMLGKENLPLEEAARLDALSEHSTSSFVNAYESTNEFSKFSTMDQSVVDLFAWIILDGNNAINRLSAAENLMDKSVLSVLELGVPRSQGKALDTFTAELNRFSSVDVTKLLGWKPPTGVNIWGWSR